MDDYKKGMGERIKLRRKELRITQEKMAEALGVSVKHLSEVERGIAGLSVDNLLKLGDLLGQSMDYLLRGTVSSNSFDALPYCLRNVPPEKEKALTELILAAIRLSEISTEK